MPPLRRILALGLLAASFAGATEGARVSFESLLQGEREAGVRLDALRLADAYRHETEYRQGFGGDLFDQFVRFLFPASGREKRTMFMPLPYWGPKKPQYKVFEWKKYESAHFEFYAYPPHDEVFRKVVAYLEEDFERNNRMFGVQGKFTKKIPVVLYQTRGDFEQTFIVGGVVPEGLGGVTEIFSWKRATFPFEGDWSKFEHVAKHEGTHIYQIAKGAKRLPLWFIEGNAETNSLFWDADAEMVIRDAFFNGFFYPVSELWQIQGSWLMYKEGNFITNLLWQEYGEEGFRKIYDRADSMPFEQNLRESLGLKIEDLDTKVQSALARRYAGELNRRDLSDTARKVEPGRVLLHARGPFYLSGGSDGPRTALYLNHVDREGKITREKVVSDREYNTESLNYFRKGAWMDDHRVVYAVKKSSHDEIRVSSWSFDEKRKKFKIRAPKSYAWPSIEIMESPVLVGENRIAFVGQSGGFANVYLYDVPSRKLEALTQGTKHHAGLDYSPARNALVFSREDERAADRIYYNRELYFLDLATRELTRLTQTPGAREEEPRFSPDGSYVAYASSGRDRDLTHDLYLYHLPSKKARRISRMRVGARSPQWGQESSILFNGFDRMRPVIYQAAFPKASDLLALDLPAASAERLAYRAKQWVLQPGGAAAKPADPSPGTGGAFVVAQPPADAKPSPAAPTSAAPAEAPESRPPEENEKYGEMYPTLAFREEGDVYTAKAAASLGDRWILRAKRGLPDQKEAEDQLSYRYFAWDKDGFASLDTRMVSIAYLRPAEKKRIETKLDGRVIVNAFVDGPRALLTVNNRLARENEKYRKRPDLSFVLYDLAADAYQELPDGLIEDADDEDKTIQWVSFLAEGRILFAVSAARRGPYDLHAYDPGKRAYERWARDAERFRVSADRRFVAWAEEGELWFRAAGSPRPARVRLSVPDARIFAFHFKDDGLLQVFTARAKAWRIHEYDPAAAKESAVFPIPRPAGARVDLVVFDEKTGDAVLRTKYAGKPEGLSIWFRASQETYDLAQQGEGYRYDGIQFRGGYLFFTERRHAFERPREWVWKDKRRDPLEPVQRAEKLSDRRWILAGPSKISYADFNDGATPLQRREGRDPDPASPVREGRREPRIIEVAKENAGFAAAKGKVYYSAPQDDAFSIFEYDPAADRHARPIACETQCVLPSAGKDRLYWSARRDGRWQLEDAGFADLAQKSAAGLDGYDLVRPVVEGEDVTVSARGNAVAPYAGPALTHGRDPSVFVQNRPFSNVLRLQSLNAAAAFDGSDFRFFASGFLDNLFSDRGVFVDSIFLGDAKFATIGYADLRYGDSYTFFFNSRSGIKNFGPGYTKTFLLDRFQELNLYGQFEIQQYGTATLDTAAFVGADIENRNFYLAKAGVAYGYDATNWDYHGPVRGSRFFLRGEGGYDAVDTRVSNLDANLDARLYNQILPRFGFAHRLVAGTSQGPLPNVFLLGGNLSFRGVGFDDLQGQNYWAFSEDLRVPVFDFVGAKFFDPVDLILGPFTRFFDIRSGLYGDVGQVWFNDGDPDLLYSVGYFVNVPTLLGINFRFNQGFYGKKALGIWLGTNW